MRLRRAMPLALAVQHLGLSPAAAFVPRLACSPCNAPTFDGRGGDLRGGISRRLASNGGLRGDIKAPASSALRCLCLRGGGAPSGGSAGGLVALWRFGRLVSKGALSSFQQGWRERSAAAGSSRAYLGKFLLEIVLAVTFQLLAEIERRRGHFWFEFDYVVAGVLTAVVGKGYTAWATAPTITGTLHGSAATTKSGGTQGSGVDDDSGPAADPAKASRSALAALFAGVPTNAFAAAGAGSSGGGELTVGKRALALVKPAPRLFAVGALSALIGYGAAAVLTVLRACCLGAALGDKAFQLGAPPPPCRSLGPRPTRAFSWSPSPTSPTSSFKGSWSRGSSNRSREKSNGRCHPRSVAPFAGLL